MCNSCHSYRASGRCSSSCMRALSNLFAVRGEKTDDCTCNCSDTCNCCSGSTGGTDSYYARQYAIGRTYVSGCNSCYMGF